MADIAQVTVRVRFAPLTLWEAIKLRIAGPEVRERLLAMMRLVSGIE